MLLFADDNFVVVDLIEPLNHVLKLLNLGFNSVLIIGNDGVASLGRDRIRKDRVVLLRKYSVLPAGFNFLFYHLILFLELGIFLCVTCQTVLLCMLNLLCAVLNENWIDARLPHCCAYTVPGISAQPHRTRGLFH
jgi:hypothetical protein